MAKKTFGLGILAMALVFGFIGCDNNPDNGPDPALLHLSGPLMRVDWENLPERPTGGHFVFTEFTQNLTVRYAGYREDLLEGNSLVTVGGSGTVVNGRLNYSVNEPLAASMVGVDHRFEKAGDLFENYSISDNDARTSYIELILVEGGVLTNLSNNQFPDYSVHEDVVSYAYFDRDVVIKGGRKSSTETLSDEEIEAVLGAPYIGQDVRISIHTSDFELRLKAGWNVITERMVAETFIIKADQTTGAGYIGTDTYISVFAGEPPNARWSLFDQDSIRPQSSMSFFSSENPEKALAARAMSILKNHR